MYLENGLHRCQEEPCLEVPSHTGLLCTIIECKHAEVSHGSMEEGTYDKISGRCINKRKTSFK